MSQQIYFHFKRDNKRKRKCLFYIGRCLLISGCILMKYILNVWNYFTICIVSICRWADIYNSEFMTVLMFCSSAKITADINKSPHFFFLTTTEIMAPLSGLTLGHTLQVNTFSFNIDFLKFLDLTKSANTKTI